MAQKFRKKPIIIEAMRMPVESNQPAVREVAIWMSENGYVDLDQDNFSPEVYVTEFIHDGKLLPEFGANYLNIDTLEGVMEAKAGDWVVKGLVGEFYPVKPDIFEASYEAVIDEESKS